MRNQGMCVRACVLVLPAHSVIAVWSAWCGTFMALEIYCLVDENLLSAKMTKICFGLLTELRNGSVHLGRGTPFGVEFLDLSWWDGLVGLSSGAIHGLDPQDSVLLVIAGKHHSVAFLHGVEESPAAVQACCDGMGSSTLSVPVGCVVWLQS